MSLQRKLSFKDQVDVNRPSKQRPAEKLSSPCSPMRSLPSTLQSKQAGEARTATEPTPVREIPVRELSSNCSIQTEAVLLTARSPQTPSISQSEAKKFVASTKASKDPVEKSATQAYAVSRPLSTPISAPMSNGHVPSMVQTMPLCAASRVDSNLSQGTLSYASQSYRNAIMGSTLCATSDLHSSSSPSPSPASSQLLISPERKNQCWLRSDLSFGTVVPEVLPNQPQLMGDCVLQEGNDTQFDPSMLNDVQSSCLYYSGGDDSRMNYADELPAASLAHQVQGPSADDFPHLDIINYLLDDEYSIGELGMMGPVFQNSNTSNHPLNQQFAIPGDVGLGLADVDPSIDYCAFNVVDYSDDKMQRTYNYSSSMYDGLMDGAFNVGLSGYMNGEIDGVIQNQWSANAADLSLLGMRNGDGDGSSYQLPNYLCGINGYTVFRPASGH